MFALQLASFIRAIVICKKIDVETKSNMIIKRGKQILYMDNSQRSTLLINTIFSLAQSCR